MDNKKCSEKSKKCPGRKQAEPKSLDAFHNSSSFALEGLDENDFFFLSVKQINASELILATL